MLPRATGYAATVGCSAAVGGGRPTAAIREQELAAVSFVRIEFDEQTEVVEASVLGMAKQRAVRRGLAGCTLERSGLARADMPALEHRATAAASVEPWPIGDGIDRRPDPAGLDRAALEAVIDAAFAEPDPDAPRRTRAVVIDHDGRLLIERYAEGFDAGTPLPGWSMAKSVTNALVGILVGRGELELDAPAPVPEWQQRGDDPRAAITLDHLLRMSSGLAWE